MWNRACLQLCARRMVMWIVNIAPSLSARRRLRLSSLRGAAGWQAKPRWLGKETASAGRKRDHSATGGEGKHPSRDRALRNEATKGPLASRGAYDQTQIELACLIWQPGFSQALYNSRAVCPAKGWHHIFHAGNA